MKNVTEKDTKKVILAAYDEALAKIEQLKATSFDPQADKEENEKSAILNRASVSAAKGIFNEETVKEYNDLISAIGIKKQELEELINIENSVNSLAAIVDSKETLVTDYESRIDDLRNTVSTLEDELNAKEDELMESIEKEREREQEQYTYDLNRKRKLEADKYQDELAKTNKELDERIAQVEIREDTISAKEDHIKDLESQIELFPTALENAKSEAVEETKKSMNTSFAFEKRALTSDKEHSEALLNAKIENLEDKNSSLAAENAELRQKLDTAYAEMKDLASTTVQSTGTKEIVYNQTK